MFANLRILGQAAVAAWVLVGWAGNCAAGAQSVCADLGGAVDPDQICRAHIVGSGYTLDLSFPVDYPDQQPLTDYLTHTRDEWVHDGRTQPSVDRPPYVLVITGDAYQSGTPTSGTRSVVLEMNQDFGAHPVGSFKAFNYDRGKGAPVTFATLFKPGTNPLGVLNPIVQRKFGPLPFGDPGLEAYQNFAITDDAVIFFFNQDGLLPHEDGPLEVSVPRGELAPWLA